MGLKISPCCGCGSYFGYDPVKVPVRIMPEGGRYPLCEDCVTDVNVIRRDWGYEPISIPAGAYIGGDDASTNGGRSSHA